MKKHHIWIIIVLMAVSLLGLLFLQYQWIKDSIQIKESNFEQTVQNVLLEVSQKLEKFESRRLIQQKVSVITEDPSPFTNKPLQSAKQANGIPPSFGPSRPQVISTTTRATIITFDKDCMVPEEPIDPQILRKQYQAELSKRQKKMFHLLEKHYEMESKYLLNPLGYNENKAFLGIIMKEPINNLGVPIDYVMPYGPADFAGLKVGDLIAGINGVPVHTELEVISQLGKYNADDEIDITFKRNILNYTPPVTAAIIQPKKDPLLNSHVEESANSLMVDLNEFYHANFKENSTLATLAEKENIQKVQRKFDQFKELAIEMIYIDIPVQDRINPSVLDSMLYSSMLEAGIEHPYHYALKTEGGCLLYADQEHMDPLFDSPLRKTVYQDEIFSQPAELIVYFPEQTKHVWQSARTMLGSSVLFNLIIIFCFAYTIRTIFRQKKLSDMKTDFINNMTHELKTPISTIKLVCEMLTDSNLSRSENSINRYANIIQDENARLQNHVEKVLQFARLEKGNLKFKIERLDMHDILEGAIQKIALQVDKKGGVINWDFEAAEFITDGDKLHLTNVIYNLLDNAVKYSDTAPDIMVSTRSNADFFTISIQDKGIGMTKEALKRVFDKFYRVSTGNIHNVKGFGLGLSYVKLMVDAHEGTVNAISKPGKGSTFEFSIPHIYARQNIKHALDTEVV